MGGIVQADRGQDKELQRRLCSRGVGLSSKLKFYKSLMLAWHVYGAAKS